MAASFWEELNTSEIERELQGEVVGCHYVSLSRRIVICRDSVSLIPWFLGYVFWVFPTAPPEEVRQRKTLGSLGWYEPPTSAGTGQPWLAIQAGMPSEAG